MYSVFQYVFGKSIFEIIKEGNLEELMRFLDQYPDKIESINSEGFTPLYCALVYNNNDISVELVRRGANIPVLNPGGALHWALDTNRQSIALVLVGKEQDINIIDGSYQTPLMKAVMRGWLNVVDRLLKRNADVTIQNQVGLTALMLAIEYGQIEIANRLIEHRDGLEASDQSGRTAIYYVIGHQNYLLLQKLISCGARINVSDENGWRPLHKASSEFFEEGVRLLLTEGADPNVTDENGWTALHLAAWKGYDTIVRCLLELCKLPSTLSLESESKDEGESPPIRRTPINMNKKTSDGSTPIMWALRGTSGQHKLIFDLLLEAGADLNIQNDEGSTVLHKAMQLGYATIATKLYLNGADPTIKNQDGHTPLDVAKDDKIRKLLEFTIEKNKILSQSI